VRVCYWGTYDQAYPRNRIIISGLRQNGIEVIECHLPVWKDTQHKVNRAFSSWMDVRTIVRWGSAYLGLLLRGLRLKGIDCFIVGYSGHFDVFPAKLLSLIKGKPLVFDAFLSLYDSLVGDRQAFPPNSFKGRLLFTVDKYACTLADLVLLDTEEHIRYFRETFDLPASKFRSIPIGADDSIFFPHHNQSNGQPFTVIHFGRYIPLHGLQYVVQAAKYLEDDTDIRFQFVGSGELFDKIYGLSQEMKVENIEFIASVEQQKLADYIDRADVALGIFGDTDKARRVVPNKVYEALAMGKPVLTGKSPATENFLAHGKTAFLCNMADGRAIAEGIKCLKQNLKWKNHIAEKGLKLFNERAKPIVIGNLVKQVLLEVAGQRA